MFTEALYYPRVLIPDNLWLRRVILYWDKIKPIVPEEVEQEIPQTHISKELKNYGMLEFIHPEHVLTDYYMGSELSQFFLNIVTSEKFRSKIGPPQKRNYEVRIHRHKFTDGLLEELKGSELFKEINYNWLLFETNSGIIYLGFLASSLANCLNLEPITDNKIYQDGFLWSQLIPSAHPELSISSLVLEKLLPAPREEVSVKQIIKFKEKHEKELLAFRRLIRDTLKSLESVDESQFKRILNSVKDDIKEQSLILDRKLKENKIKTIFNVLEVPFKLSKRDVVVMGGAIGATIISIPVSVALFGVNAAIKIGR